MWTLSCASAQGLNYFREGKNNQDAISSWSDGENAVIFINDGCHAGKYSEVGALLSNHYLVRKASEMVLQKTPLPSLAGSLFKNYLDFLQWQVDCQFFDNSDTEIPGFIANYLMCTALGIIATPSEVMFLSVGDGSFYLNDKIFETIHSPDNRPAYPAYNLYKRFGFNGSDEIDRITPTGFKTTLFPSGNISLVGMASDGLNDLPQLIEELHDHSKTSVSLQLNLNRIACIRAETIDNVSVCFIQKKEI